MNTVNGDQEASVAKTMASQRRRERLGTCELVPGHSVCCTAGKLLAPTADQQGVPGTLQNCWQPGSLTFKCGNYPQPAGLLGGSERDGKASGPL